MSAWWERLEARTLQQATDERFVFDRRSPQGVWLTAEGRCACHRVDAAGCCEHERAVAVVLGRERAPEAGWARLRALVAHPGRGAPPRCEPWHYRPLEGARTFEQEVAQVCGLEGVAEWILVTWVATHANLRSEHRSRLAGRSIHIDIALLRTTAGEERRALATGIVEAGVLRRRPDLTGSRGALVGLTASALGIPALEALFGELRGEPVLLERAVATVGSEALRALPMRCQATLLGHPAREVREMTARRLGGRTPGSLGA